jgi:uncharacterized protein (DUF1015 family)
MIHIHPFPALRPPGNLAAAVACVPYDVISTEEARAAAAGKPHSFLRVVRSEIDLDPGVSPYDGAVYRSADEALQAMLRDGVLQREAAPSLYLYRQVMDGRAQLGLVACVEVAQYRSGEIRRHEKTRPDKEDDRTRHLLATACHAEPVFLCLEDEGDRIAALMAAETSTRPIFHFVADDGVTHTGWKVGDPAPFIAAFAGLDRLYIADGHHRSAGAERAATASAEANPHHRGDEAYTRFLAVIFPKAQLAILPYHRLVRDLGGLDEALLLSRLAEAGSIREEGADAPSGPGEVAFRVGGRWRTLRFDPATIPADDPIGRLDVSLLQERVLSPILGIEDPRRDPRIEFIGGIRGTAALAAAADACGGIAFSMHPTALDELIAVADAERIMPPKSTWFEPKLRSGLFIHEFERLPAPVEA